VWPLRASWSDWLSPPDSGLYDGRVQTVKNVIVM
jgi:hypothetical protein